MVNEIRSMQKEDLLVQVTTVNSPIKNFEDKTVQNKVVNIVHLKEP